MSNDKKPAGEKAQVTPPAPSTPPPTTVPGVATLSVGPTPSAPEVLIAVAPALDDKFVKVTPRMNVGNCRIGKEYYSFQKGRAVKVPAYIVPHLAEKNII